MLRNRTSIIPRPEASCMPLVCKIPTSAVHRNGDIDFISTPVPAFIINGTRKSASPVIHYPNQSLRNALCKVMPFQSQKRNETPLHKPHSSNIPPTKANV
ncbi:hypothetical protein TNCV_3219091 [Trichonephila clavipes]|nr:hypothetical protein TNCV_3219091 [Trichonephila clavipes]